MQVTHRFTGKALGEFDLRPGANLSKANLSRANLRGVNLSRANLSGADFYGAYLGGAYLHGANLRVASLNGADLTGANLTGANLRDADLRDADLLEADLTNCKLSKGWQLPAAKSLVVWKKLGGELLAQLRIPCRAKRTASLVGNKCRAERAVVLGIWGGTEAVALGYSMHDTNFKYEVGKEVSVSDYDGDPRVECTTGIHFFRTRAEAETY